MKYQRLLLKRLSVVAIWLGCVCMCTGMASPEPPDVAGASLHHELPAAPHTISGASAQTVHAERSERSEGAPPDSVVRVELDPLGGDTSGVCCHPTGLCDNLTQDECAAADGVWLGPDGVCLDCPTATCPDNSLYSQPPDGWEDDWNAVVSDAMLQCKHYEHFEYVPGPITDIHWWGINSSYHDSMWWNCVKEDSTFVITFYYDVSDDEPTAEASTYTVTATREPTGVYYSSIYEDDVELIHYSAHLDPYCGLPAGWVSIQAPGESLQARGGEDYCYFLWLTSSAGDGWSVGIEEGEWYTLSYDTAFCLTDESYEPVYGACCDDETGTCTENVEHADCFGERKRFIPNGVCDDLDPPCGGIEGACCYNIYPNMECELLSETDCAALDGNWLGAHTACDACPCVVCEDWMTPEGEPDCYEGYEDTYNYGCNADPPVFSTIYCGETICGAFGQHERPWGSLQEDYDAYLFDLEEDSALTITVVGGGEEGYPDVCLYDYTYGCGGLDGIACNAVADVCSPATISAAVPRGQYMIVVTVYALEVEDQVACGTPYTLSLECEPYSLPQGACCLPDGTCEMASEDGCTRDWGRWAGEDVQCEDIECHYPRGNSCDNPVEIVWPPADADIFIDQGETYLYDGLYGTYPFVTYCGLWYSNGNDMMYRITATEDSCVMIALDHRLLANGEEIHQGSMRAGMMAFTECPSWTTEWCFDVVQNGDAYRGPLYLGPWDMLAGEEYWIVVDNYMTEAKGLEFEFTVEPCTREAPGNDCEEPIVISLPADLPYSTSESTCYRENEYPEGTAEIVYALNVESEVTVDMRFWSNRQDPVFRVYEQCPAEDPNSYIASSDGWNPNFITGLTLSPGTYYLTSANDCMHFKFEMSASELTTLGACCVDGVCIGNVIEQECGVAGWWWAGEDCATFECPVEFPENTTCETCEPIATGQVVKGSTMDLEFHAEWVSSCASLYHPYYRWSLTDINGPHVWFSWTPEECGDAVFSSAGSDYDTSLSLYWNCTDGSGAELACNDDTECSAQGEFTYYVTVGETYYIRLSGANWARGYYEFRVTMEEPIPGDVDGDGDVDIADLSALLGAYGLCEGDPGYVARADFNDDDRITLWDLAILLANYGTGT